MKERKLYFFRYAYLLVGIVVVGTVVEDIVEVGIVVEDTVDYNLHTLKKRSV